MQRNGEVGDGTEMNEQLHVMLDIETLGRTPGSVILSVGAVVFSIEKGLTRNEFHQYVSVADSLEHGLRIEADTLAWWLDTSPEMLRVFMQSRTPLDKVLGSLSHFINSLGQYPYFAHDVQIWANSPQFDLSILQAAYRRVGKSPPWDFRAERDIRTLSEVLGMPRQIMRPDEKAHDALDDAKAQARALVEMLKPRFTNPN
jgi:hypothetical protein